MYSDALSSDELDPWFIPVLVKKIGSVMVLDALGDCVLRLTCPIRRDFLVSGVEEDAVKLNPDLVFNRLLNEGIPDDEAVQIVGECW